MSAGARSLQPGSFGVWLLAARPATLPAAVVPVIVGSAVASAEGSFRPLPFLAALAAALLIQVGTNLANDYFDYQKGADTRERLGPIRVTQSGLLPPETVKRGTIATFGLATLLGIYLVLVGGWPILLIGLLSIAAGVLYTGGPWPLGYHGLGDLCVFIFFGLVAVVGTTYLHTGTWSASALIASLPVGCLVTAIIVVNNLRDVDTDRATGKHTLAVLIGRPATRWEYALLVGGAYLVVLLWSVWSGSAWLLLPGLTLPLAACQLRTVRREQGRALNLALKGTARLHLVFGLLLALGLMLGM